MIPSSANMLGLSPLSCHSYGHVLHMHSTSDLDFWGLSLKTTFVPTGTPSLSILPRQSLQAQCHHSLVNPFSSPVLSSFVFLFWHDEVLIKCKADCSGPASSWVWLETKIKPHNFLLGFPLNSGLDFTGYFSNNISPVCLWTCSIFSMCWLSLSRHAPSLFLHTKPPLLSTKGPHFSGSLLSCVVSPLDLNK